MQDLLPISCIILTHRFDERLKQAITSAAQFAEILVVCCGIEPPAHLSKLLPQIRLLQSKSIEDFSQTRNWATDHAKHDWVFHLDSDEQLLQGDQSEWQAAITQTAVAGFFVTRQDVFAGKTLKHAEGGKTKLVRLYHRRRATYVRPVHEVVQSSLPFGQLSVRLIHASHDSLRAFFTKIAQYAALEAATRSTSRPRCFLELLCYPPAKFVWNYGCRLGFLDGFAGLSYAYMMSLHSLFVRLYQLEPKAALPK